MTDCCIHTADIARRQHLRSAGCHQLFVPAFHVRSSGLFCSRPGGLELATRLPARSVTFRWQISPGPENFFSRFTTVHSTLEALRLCAIWIYCWHWIVEIPTFQFNTKLSWFFVQKSGSYLSVFFDEQYCVPVCHCFLFILWWAVICSGWLADRAMNRPVQRSLLLSPIFRGECTILHSLDLVTYCHVRLIINTDDCTKYQAPVNIFF